MFSNFTSKIDVASILKLFALPSISAHSASSLFSLTHGDIISSFSSSSLSAASIWPQRSRHHQHDEDDDDGDQGPTDDDLVVVVVVQLLEAGVDLVFGAGGIAFNTDASSLFLFRQCVLHCGEECRFDNNAFNFQLELYISENWF
jgi:hypothetical protein